MTEHFPASNITPESIPDESSEAENDVNPSELRRIMDHVLQYGTTEELMRLFDDGMDIDQEDFQGRTALMMCTAQGKMEAVKVLLDRDADINRIYMHQGRVPGTALDAARQTSRFALAELLASHGAKTAREVLAEQATETQ